MWLLSFAWRNRNLTETEGNKRKGRVKKSGRERENKCHPTLLSITLPSSTSPFNKKSHDLCMENTSSTPGQSLITASTLAENRNNLTLSPI